MRHSKNISVPSVPSAIKINEDRYRATLCGSPSIAERAEIAEGTEKNLRAHLEESVEVDIAS